MCVEVSVSPSQHCPAIFSHIVTLTLTTPPLAMAQNLRPGTAPTRNDCVEAGLKRGKAVALEGIGVCVRCELGTPPAFAFRSTSPPMSELGS